MARSHIVALMLLAMIACTALPMGAAMPPLERTAAPAQAHKEAPLQELRVQLKEGLSLSAGPPVLSELTEWVTISWKGNDDGAPYDWIGAWSPVPSSPEGFAESLPVKYLNLSLTPSASGSARMHMLHMRAPWVFGYMRGSYAKPTLLGVSNAVHYEPQLANEPMQLRLARTHDASEMRITWATHNSSKPTARISSSESFGEYRSVAAQSNTYRLEQMCENVATNVGWREPGLIHSAVFTDLKPSTEYFYQVGDPSLGLWSSPRRFYSAPARGQPNVDFLVFGDLGQAQTDGSVGWQAWTTVHGELRSSKDQPESLDTLRSLAQDLEGGGEVDPRSALMLLIGDLSYARGRQGLWEQFHHVLQPVTSRAPLMVLPGNHEVGYSQSFIPGNDSGGECGVVHAARFPMPSGSPPGQGRAAGMLGLAAPNPEPLAWYSFDHGSVHLVMLSSEHATNASSAQYAWLKADLAAVDREVTPWVFVSAHRPLYVSSIDKKSEKSDMKVAARLRRDLEPLLQQFEVDVFAAGHHHSAQRTCPVFNETCVPDRLEGEGGQDMPLRRSAGDGAAAAAAPTFGTVHLVTGAAGMWCNVGLDPEHHSWLRFATTQIHGYTRVSVRGAQELTIQFVSSADRSVWDSVTLHRGGKALGRAPRVTRNPSRSFPHGRALNEAAPGPAAGRPRRERAIELMSRTRAQATQ